MESQQTLFRYLHSTLLQEIYTGKLAYGDSLPSIKQLSTNYHAGIRTVRDVLNALRSAGYIKTEERKGTTVIYQGNSQNEQVLPVRYLFERRFATVECLAVTRDILLDIFFYCLALCTESDVQSFRKMIRGMNDVSDREKAGIIAAIVYRLITNCHNSLLIDLYVDLERFTRLPAIRGFDNPFGALNQDIEGNLRMFLDMIEQKNLKGSEQVLHAMLDNFIRCIASYYERLLAIYPKYADIPQIAFSWYTERVKQFSYMEIMRVMARDICTGVYEEGAYLPPIATLAAHFDVSIETVNKSLANLSDFGLIATQNGIGSKVTLRKAQSQKLAVCDPRIRYDFVSFFSAIHFVALTARNASLFCYENLRNGKIDEVEAEISEQNGFFALMALWRRMIDTHPKHAALEGIYAQIHQLIDWGAYLAYITQMTVADNAIITEKCKMAITWLRAGERETFADTIEQAYRYVFSMLKAFLQKYGVLQIEGQHLPDKSSGSVDDPLFRFYKRYQAEASQTSPLLN